MVGGNWHRPASTYCLEGLASGRAIELRWGQQPNTLPGDHPAWVLEASYLAIGVVNIICTISPQCIILGGGVMEQPRLLPLVRGRTQELLNGYLQVPDIMEGIEQYIVHPLLGNKSGVLGAISLASQFSR